MQGSDFKQLKVWQKAIELAKEVYLIVKLLPSDEKFALSDQMRRSVISVSSNIAEGRGRNSKKDYIHFLNIAMGSLCEVESQCYVGVEIGYFQLDQIKKVIALCGDINRMLRALAKSLEAQEGR